MLVSDVHLQCPVCEYRTALAPVFTGCPVCLAGGDEVPLEVAYTPAEARFTPTSDSGLWRWRDLLPPVNGKPLTLGEGDTPLVPLPHCGGASLFLKNETQNVTWSWKDRSGCVSVCVAREFGFRKVAAISTGNLGNAVAAYATAAGLDCVVFCHPDSPALQVAQMMSYGAKVVRGGDQSALLHDLVVNEGYFPCSAMSPQDGCSNPFGVEGLKTIAFEIVEQLGNRAPDRVFVPVGSGDGVFGVWKGFRELGRSGLIQKVPQMVACQATGADSLFRAFSQRKNHVERLAQVSTAALSVGELAAGDHALRAVYESQGTVMLSSDEETFDAMHALMHCGFAVEPSSAVAYSCARKRLPESAPDETWVVIASGAAVKWPDSLLVGFEMPAVV